MANSILTIDMITREATRLWENSNAFIMSIDRQYDDQFAVQGAKIGQALRLRLPNDYTVRTGPAMSIQDTQEQSVSLPVATQKGVDVSFNTVERTMKLDDYSERVLAPMVNNLAGAVAADIMSGTEGGICNYTDNEAAAGDILSPIAQTWLQAGALLTDNSASMTNRKVVNSPTTEARTVASLSGLFNPVPAISRQYATGKMYDALGFLWMHDQTVLSHTTGTYSAGNVNGGTGIGQTGSSVTVSAITGTLKKGDIITFSAVNAVNRITKTSTGSLRQFVVTADVATTATSIPVYPAIVPAAAGGVQVQYQTVDVGPLNGATIKVMGVKTPGTAVTYRKNFAFTREAVTMVTADLVMPKAVEEASRMQKDGISLRMLTAYIPGTDQLATRLDILYGYVWIRPEWACVVADVSP